MEDVLKEAREIVRTTPMNFAVGHLRAVADDLHEAYDILKIELSRKAAVNFIAHFNRTLLAIERVHELTPPAPTGGRMPVDKKTEIDDKKVAAH